MVEQEGHLTVRPFASISVNFSSELVPTMFNK